MSIKLTFRALALRQSEQVFQVFARANLLDNKIIANSIKRIVDQYQNIAQHHYKVPVKQTFGSFHTLSERTFVFLSYTPPSKLHPPVHCTQNVFVQVPDPFLMQRLLPSYPGCIAIYVKQGTFGQFTISSCPSTFLVVSFKGLWHCVVDDVSD